jgi:molybdate transport system substrate-binding protein
VERAGNAIIGSGRAELLEAIDRWHSISAAAREIGMSYRHAWMMVQGINEAAGQPLVVATTGGSQGGGAHLTPLGRSAVSLFQQLQGQIRQSAADAWDRVVQVQSTTVHVAAAVSLQEVLGQVLADYAVEEPAVSVRAIFGASDELAGVILTGAPVDLFLSADDHQVDRLEATALIEPGSRTVLAGDTLAAIGPANRRVLVRQPSDLLHPSIGPIALAKTAAPLGNYSDTYLKNLDLYDRLLPRLVRLDNAGSVVAALQTGRADVGFVYRSQVVHAADCRVLFQTSRSAVPIRFAAAIIARGQPREAPRSFLGFLTSGTARRRFRRCGFFSVHATGRSAS